MSSMFVGDISDIMEEFPQAVVYSDNGVVTFISKNMIESINESFESHKCLQCGHIQNDANVDSVTSFL